MFNWAKSAVTTSAMTTKGQSSQMSATKPLRLATMAVLSCAVLSACGSGHEEIKAVDKVEEAAKMARANAPKAEVMEFQTTVPAATEAAVTTDPVATTDSTAAAPTDSAAATGSDTTTAATEVLSADAGKTLYERQCQACHASGVLGAPKFGDKEAWSARIAQGKEVLYQHSSKGFNQMPAQASGDITEAQVHAAVDYMVSKAS
ncbi:MAG: c-type cytochrome [Psychrobacter sp.]|nr:c-type cytochrome [Psychrobacter sp.]